MELVNFIANHWVAILATVTSAYAGLVEVASRISQYMPAPTTESTQRYKFWFVVVNVIARNPARAKNLSHIEDSPNFIPAAEGYMRKRLADAGLQAPPPLLSENVTIG